MNERDNKDTGVPRAAGGLGGLVVALLLTFAGLLRAQGQDEGRTADIDHKTYDPSTLLWYHTAATVWDQALPIGNGRLGAMVFGKTGEERIQLNESTYWTGGPYSTVVKDGFKKLGDVQKLVFDGQYLAAHNLFGRYLMGYPVEQQKYQSLANLLLSFPEEKTVTAYKRWLDLETGITGVEYESNGVTFRRTVFASAPGQVIVVRMTASRSGSISLVADLHGVRNQTHSDYATDYFRMDGYGPDGLILTGKSADYMGVQGKIRYEARLKAVQQGGKMHLSGNSLIIEQADTVTLYFSAATNFVNYKDVSADPHDRVDKVMKAIGTTSFYGVRASHLADYRRLFGRVSLQLPATEFSFLPTDERVRKGDGAADPSLAALAYQFGRYVLISCSRPGGQAANLQGIWNNDMNPMWDAKYTTNINLQMAYWVAEQANLPECAGPLIDLVRDLTDEGGKVAKEHYGCRGWVFHQNTDLWRVAAPMDGPTWGTFTVGGAWLCTHLWEHYLFTMDTGYLRSVYPVIKGAVEFFRDFLVATPDGKWLVTNPSTSPENFPDRPDNGPYFDEVTGAMLPGTTICAGSAIDMEILTDLFNDYRQAAEVLTTDRDFADTVGRMMTRLAPPSIGKDELLQEWREDWGQGEKQHRHLSPLYGLYPGNVFSVERTPGLAAACRRVLEQRGDGSSGWSMAWKTALWTRLHDGDRACKIFKGYMEGQANPQLFAKCGAPMQIDGTMGMAAAIGEMLVQSHEGVIELLPALPREWAMGEFRGVCSRGAFTLDMKWSNGKLTQVKIVSKQGKICRIRERMGRIREFPTIKDGIYVLEDL